MLLACYALYLVPLMPQRRYEERALGSLVMGLGRERISLHRYAADSCFYNVETMTLKSPTRCIDIIELLVSDDYYTKTDGN